jgi:repressor LexA
MESMKPLTDKQKDILIFIEEFINDFGYPPTIRDIQNNCDISSTSVVKYNLDRLQEKGLMTRESEVSRGINLKSDPKNTTIKVPVIGTITAGETFPLFDDNRWEYDDMNMLELPDNFSYLEEKLYALKVSGTSMIDALIGDGDTVIMEKTKSVNNGDMVAANVISENETTLKRIYKEGENIRLQPENPLMKALIYPSKNISILGRVVAVWRNLNK